MNSEAIAEIAEILNLDIEDAENWAPVLKDWFGSDAPKEQRDYKVEDLADEFGFFSEDAETAAENLTVLFSDDNDAPKEQKENEMSDDTVTAKPSKIKCKVCGFFKKPKKVLRETGCCAVCTAALSESGEDGTVEVIGRMGKRGRNTVSIVRDGQRFRVKRLSNRHSERIAAKHAAKPKGHAKRAKRTSTPPTGLPTNSRLRDDERG